MPTREPKQHGPSQPAPGRRLSLKTTRLRQLTMEDLSRVNGGDQRGEPPPGPAPLSPSWWCWWPF
jgi:hypothetical protein